MSTDDSRFVKLHADKLNKKEGHEKASSIAKSKALKAKKEPKPSATEKMMHMGKLQKLMKGSNWHE